MPTTLSGNTKKGKKKGSPEKVVLNHIYLSAKGEKLYGVSHGDNGSVNYGHFHGEHATTGLNGVAKVPYRLPEVIKTDRVFLVSTESIADRVANTGLVASTVLGGFSRFDHLLAGWFKKKNVIILCERDHKIEKLITILTPIANRVQKVVLKSSIYKKLSSGQLNQSQILNHCHISDDDIYWKTRKEFAESMTDAGNASRLVSIFGDKVRYCSPWGKFLIWDESRWKEDSKNEVVTLAVNVSDTIWDEVKSIPRGYFQELLIKWHKQSRGAAKINSMLELVKSRPEIAVTNDELDRNPLLFACRNGVYDFAHGIFRESDLSDMITKNASFSYNERARSDDWDLFISGSSETPGYSREDQREYHLWLSSLAAYTMTGDTSLEEFYFVWGPGGTGKSTFAETLYNLLGDYAGILPIQSLTSRDQHPTDLAGLEGKRLAVASETEKGEYFIESKLKMMTGENYITARLMRQDFFQYKKQFKLMILANHKLMTRSIGSDMKRRLRVVPFLYKSPNPDLNLKDKKLPNQLPGVFNSITTFASRENSATIKGILDRLKRVPRIVREQTDGYFEEMDTLGSFFSDYCELRDDLRVPKRYLYTAYKHWSNENGHSPLGAKTFALDIKAREENFGEVRSSVDRYWTGITLKNEIYVKAQHNWS